METHNEMINQNKKNQDEIGMQRALNAELLEQNKKNQIDIEIQKKQLKNVEKAKEKIEEKCQEFQFTNQTLHQKLENQQEAFNQQKREFTDVVSELRTDLENTNAETQATLEQKQQQIRKMQNQLDNSGNCIIS